jgi:hypothetical protein
VKIENDIELINGVVSINNIELADDAEQVSTAAAPAHVIFAL